MWYWILISAVFSGLLTVIISIYYQRRSENKRLKLRLLQQLFGYRHEIHGQKFIEAMNQIPVAFSGCKDILYALKAFNEVAISNNGNTDLANQRLLDLFILMYKHLKIDIRPLNDIHLLSTFSNK